MKIAFIGHKRIPSREGGVEIVVGELAERMAAMGHTVHAYNRMGGNPAGAENRAHKLKSYKEIRIITIPTIDNKNLNAIVYTVLASIRALFGGYDVIHFHAEGPCSMLWLPHMFGIRTVATIHGLNWQLSKWGGFASKFLKFGEKVAAKYADEVIVLSENIKKYFLDTYGRETVFLANGVSVAPPIRADIIKEKYGLDENGYVLFLARVSPEKGAHYLIEAYKRLNTDKKLVIAGGAGYAEGYMEELKALAGGDENIIFTGFVTGDELTELYSNCLFYVLPSDSEGMPMSILEAMSYGKICLTSDIKESTQLTGEYGFSFRKGDADDLKDKLEILLGGAGDSIDRAAMSEFVRNGYSWDTVVEKTLELYAKA